MREPGRKVKWCEESLVAGETEPASSNMPSNKVELVIRVNVNKWPIRQVCVRDMMAIETVAICALCNVRRRSWGAESRRFVLELADTTMCDEKACKLRQTEGLGAGVTSSFGDQSA
jgi:hypothetical protein